MKKNTEKLTKEFCENNTLVFSIKNKKDSIFLQLTLLDMGFSWAVSYATVHAFKDTGNEKGKYALENPKQIKVLGKDFKHGIKVNDGILIECKPNDVEDDKAILCRVSDFLVKPKNDSWFANNPLREMSIEEIITTHFNEKSGDTRSIGEENNSLEKRGSFFAADIAKTL